MKILAISDSIDDTITVPLGSTLRYIQINSSMGFRTVNAWTNAGLIRQNICGIGHSDSKANCCCIPFTPSFDGQVTKLRVRLPKKYVNETNCTFRWAVTEFRDDNAFKGHDEPKSEYLMAHGKFNAKNQYIYMPVTGLEDGDTYYIYLTPSNRKYGNFHIVDDVTIDIYTATGSKIWRNTTSYIYKNGGWKKASPYVYKNGRWTAT